MESSQISVADSDYYKAEMKDAFYIQDIDGIWKEITLSDGKINSYDIDQSGNLLFQGKQISGLLIEAKNRFHSQMENERARRAKEEQQHVEKMKRLLEEQKKQYQEYQKRLEEQEKKRQLLQEEIRKREAEIAEKKRIEEEKQQEEKRKREETFRQAMADNFTQQNEQVKVDNLEHLWAAAITQNADIQEKLKSKINQVHPINLRPWDEPCILSYIILASRNI